MGLNDREQGQYILILVYAMDIFFYEKENEID